MKIKVWLAVLMVAGLLAVALGTTTAFAQNPPAIPPYADNATWAEMQQACGSGDFEAMQKLHNEYCGSQNGMMSGNWSGGMMGGWQGGGMMGGWNRQDNNQQSTPRYGGGMMSGGRRGMMGTW